VQHHDAVFAIAWQGELNAGAARQAVNRIAPRRKSKGLLDRSNLSKRRSTDHEIVAPPFWEYPSRTVTHRSERMCHLADVGCLATSSVWTAVRAIANCGWSRYAKPRNCSA
jgi:hypothetical protein